MRPPRSVTLFLAVLALPAYQLMRADQRVENGRLSPVLSSMFRVTDGLRMTMHHMLFIPFGEPTRHPDTPMTAAEVHAYAERAFSFISDHGVCAGPKAMVDEFLAVLVDGAVPAGTDTVVPVPAVAAALAWPAPRLHAQRVSFANPAWAAVPQIAAPAPPPRWTWWAWRMRQASARTRSPAA